jgi:hypothetical protein
MVNQRREKDAMDQDALWIGDQIMGALNSRADALLDGLETDANYGGNIYAILSLPIEDLHAIALTAYDRALAKSRGHGASPPTRCVPIPRAARDVRAGPRGETHTALTRGTLRAPNRTTLEQAADEWLRAAEAGVVRTRSGDRYKPSALRGYEEALRHKLLPSLGHLRLSTVARNAAQDLVDGLVAEGASASTCETPSSRCGRYTAARSRAP